MILRYRYIEQRSYHVLEIELETGRHHQIRVQLAGVGLHIKGDLVWQSVQPTEYSSSCTITSISPPDNERGNEIHRSLPR